MDTLVTVFSWNMKSSSLKSSSPKSSSLKSSSLKASGEVGLVLTLKGKVKGGGVSKGFITDL